MIYQIAYISTYQIQLDQRHPVKKYTENKKNYENP